MILTQNESWQQLIDQLPTVVFEYTFFPDGHRDFTYISPRSRELLGIDPAVIINGHLSITNFIHPDDFASFNESVEECVREVKDWRWEGRCKGKSGYIWLETQSSPLKTEDGRIVFSGIFSDITEKKHLEERYRDLVDQLPLGIVVHAKGKVKLANTYAAKMLGVTNSHDMVGMEVWPFVHKDYHAAGAERIQRILDGEILPPAEFKYIRVNGEVIDVENSTYKYVYKGEPAIQVIFTDITEKKKKEASFKKTETLLDQLFQNTPLAVTLLNEEGNVVQVNKGFEEMFGYSGAELQGNSLNKFIVPLDLKDEGNDLNSLISSNGVVKTETLRHRKDKTQLSVIIYGVPVQMEDKTLGIFGMYVDITERKKVEEELKIRNTELDNFVYKVSHDLRAPLSSVLGLAHLATLPGNNDNLLDYIKLMGQKAEQLDHFISDVLSHSKNLKMDLKVEKVDFKKIIDQTFNDLNYLKGAEQVRKDIIIKAEDFQSDPWRIAEIFRNLVSNAIKYRKLKNSQTFLTITVDTDDKQCSIFFKDNGIGIDQASLEKIFEMFYRASDQSEGSGLGLYIVRNAVEKLGGKVTVQSKLGEGTSFKITLPNHPLAK